MVSLLLWFKRISLAARRGKKHRKSPPTDYSAVLNELECSNQGDQWIQNYRKIQGDSLRWADPPPLLAAVDFPHFAFEKVTEEVTELLFASYFFPLLLVFPFLYLFRYFS